jgi:hypothetical protein
VVRPVRIAIVVLVCVIGAVTYVAWRSLPSAGGCDPGEIDAAQDALVAEASSLIASVPSLDGEQISAGHACGGSDRVVYLDLVVPLGAQSEVIGQLEQDGWESSTSPWTTYWSTPLADRLPGVTDVIHAEMVDTGDGDLSFHMELLVEYETRGMKAPQVAGVVGVGLAVLVARLIEFGLESMWVSLLMPAPALRRRS